MASLTKTARVADWLGLKRNVLVSYAAMLVLGMGEELWVRFVPKYLELLGAGAFGVALYGVQKELLDAVYPYPGGWLADRLGRRKALALFTLLAFLGYGLYLAAPRWEWVIAGTFLVMAWSSLTLPALFAVIGDHLPSNRRAIGFGVQSIVKRVPIALAPPLGGLGIAALGFIAGMQLGLAITMALAGLAVFLVLAYYVEKPPTAVDRSFRGVWHTMDAGLKRLLLADCLARWAEGIPKVFVVLYVMDVLWQDALTFGYLTAVQMFTAILVYIPIAKLADQANRKPFVLLTFAFFALFPLALVQATGPAGLVPAFAVAGLREVGEPARKALIVDLSDAAVRGRAVGMYYLLRGLAVFPAPLVGGWLWTQDPRWPFYAAFGVGVAGVLAYALQRAGEKPLP